MSNRMEITHRLLNTLKELERERQYRGLKRYVRSLKRKGYVNGKERYFLKGATGYLNRLQADRRARSLGLAEFIPYNERMDEPDKVPQSDYRVWSRTIESFLRNK